MQRTALNTASALFAAISLMHLIRYLRKVEVKVGQKQVPVRVSLPAAVIFAILALWMADSTRHA